jgi:hypothetical protein
MGDINHDSLLRLNYPTMHAALFRTKKNEITDEEISQRAYLIWVRRGRPKGYESEIWREADLELRFELKVKGKSRRFFQRTFGGAPA